MKRTLLSIATVFLFQSADAQTFTRIEAAANLSQIANTNGVAVADYDQDGDLDIFFTGYKNFKPNDPGTWSHLMRNNGDETFTDVTVEAGFGIQYINEGLHAERGEKMGASWGDYDNDGFPDLFLANSRLDQLYHNNGNGTFTDVTAQAGVEGCIVCYSSSGLWWDHDRDGDLDLYVSVLNNENFMYQNNGDGTFTNVTELTGLEGADNAITWSAVAFDAGKDNILDLYCLNDTQSNEFFENRSGQKYNESALAYRLADEGASMGMAIGDCNNDGRFDIYVTNIYNHLPNPLFVDKGNRRYENKALEYGVEDTGWGWGTAFLDYDHDGDEDLAAVNGPIDDLYGVVQPDIDNVLFKNMLLEEDLHFENVSDETGFLGKAKSKGLEAFDYDQDGDLDMVVANMEEGAYFFQNSTISGSQPTDKNWLQVKLEGTMSNRDGFGATVKIRIGDRWLYRYHQGAAIFGGSVKPVHFGLGEASVIDEIHFTWLTGITEAIYDVPANQLLHFKEGSGTVVKEDTGTVQPGGAIVEKHFAKPNPFSNETILHFELAAAGSLQLRIFNSIGRLVHESTEELPDAGVLDIPWGGARLASGVYFYVAQFKDKKLEGRIVKGR